MGNMVTVTVLRAGRRVSGQEVLFASREAGLGRQRVQYTNGFGMATIICPNECRGAVFMGGIFAGRWDTRQNNRITVVLSESAVQATEAIKAAANTAYDLAVRRQNKRPVNANRTSHTGN